MSDDTIILHEMVPKWNKLFKQKGQFRQIHWCEVHDAEKTDTEVCWMWNTWAFSGDDCRIVDKWLEA